MTRTVLSHGRLIEVETVPAAGAKRQRREKRDRHMGAPWAFWVALCEAKLPWSAVVLAIYIYRRVAVAGRNTVTLAAADLRALGIPPQRSSPNLRRLAAAGFVRLDVPGRGRSCRVTLLWAGVLPKT